MFKKFNNFLKNTSGSILPTLGILIVPLGITIGAAVDYTLFVNIRNEIQTGVDAAGIASAAELVNIQQTVDPNLKGSARDNAIKAELEVYASAFLGTNITSRGAQGAYNFELEYIPETAATQGGVRVIANFEYDTIFGGLSGGDGGPLLFDDTIEGELSSLVRFGNRRLEVALVMDNSGSMGRPPRTGGIDKIDAMKNATATLVSRLNAAASNSVLEDSVKFSLVPFSGTVNVGKDGHDNHDGDFIDRRGFNPVNNENLDWDDTFQNTASNSRNFIPADVVIENRHVVKIDDEFKSRLDVFKMLRTDWAGCVEMRPWPYNTLDTYVEDNGTYNSINNQFDSDGNGQNDGTSALFVPYFAPDEPDRNHLSTGSNGSNTFRRDNDFFTNSYLIDYVDGKNRFVYTERNSRDIANGARGQNRQIERTNWLFKYQRFQNFRSDNFNGRTRGPNRGCTTQPITALTTDITNVEDAIDNMNASGVTNIQQGLTWGWRTLSEGLPFDQGRSLTDETNLKFIILLTDGNNFYQEDGDITPNNSAYGAWGYARSSPASNIRHAISGKSTHNRMADGVTAADLNGTLYEGESFNLSPTTSDQFTELMNVHTAQSCENIKADGISIYTIAYDLNPSDEEDEVKRAGIQRTLDLMTACAGSGLIDNRNVIRNVQFSHNAEGVDLDDTFNQIASSISALRLAQ